jgi:hypothetical protein
MLQISIFNMMNQHTCIFWTISPKSYMSHNLVLMCTENSTINLHITNKFFLILHKLYNLESVNTKRSRILNFQ